MKKLVSYLLVVLTLLSLTIFPSAAIDPYYIENYDIKLEVTEANIYKVQEEIEVFFTTDRRGIFRTIPLFSSDSKARVENIKLIGDTPYQVNYDSNSVEIRIGDPDIFIRGKKTYKIQYDFIIGKDKNSQYDEFYYNLIGGQWDTKIKNANFTITMPKAFDSSKLSFKTGYLDRDGDDSYVDYKVTGNTIEASLNKELDAYEAVTAVLVLPEGYYSKAEELGASVGVYRYLMYALAMLLIGLFFILWRKYGKDEKLVAPIQFYPPENMTPAELGYLANKVVNPRDVTSLIIYWASKGYLNIVEDVDEGDGILSKVKNKITKPKFTLVKLKDLDDAKDFENIMFDDLFDSYGDGEKVSSDELKQTFHQTMSVVMTRVKAHFSLEERRLYTKKSQRLRALAHGLSIIPAMSFLAVIFSYEFYSLGLGLAISFMTSFLFALVIGIVLNYFSNNQYMGLSKLIAPALIVLVLTISIVFLGSLFIESVNLNILDIIVLAGSILIMNFLATIMPQRTKYGNKVMNEFLGFKNFIQTAEKDRLERLIDENSTYYYDVLAYAIVMDVSDVWADKFEDITLEPPSWYISPLYARTSFNAMVFNRHFSQSFNTLQNTMASKPPSQRGGASSFSGGSAGGGAGGGGGGSW